jgi:opacity protein-like surface antigen
MKQTQSLRTLGTLVALTAVLVAFPFVAHAEWYVAGQVGANVPQGLSSATGEGTATGRTFSTFGQQTSFLYGAKLGYYFQRYKWLGVETEAYSSTPNVKEQNINSNFGTTRSGGQLIQMTTWAMNVVIRHTGWGQFQPYAGAGLGLYFANLNGINTTNNWVPGANAIVGGRFFMTKQAALFVEYKFNYAAFRFDNALGAGAHLDANYTANIAVAGLSYHF